jgi:hypothetical protein
MEYEFLNFLRGTSAAPKLAISRGDVKTPSLNHMLAEGRLRQTTGNIGWTANVFSHEMSSGQRRASAHRHGHEAMGQAQLMRTLMRTNGRDGGHEVIGDKRNGTDSLLIKRE